MSNTPETPTAERPRFYWRQQGFIPSGLHRSPYVAVMAAAERGRGLHLTADEVLHLSRDDAIASVAEYDYEGVERD